MPTFRITALCQNGKVSKGESFIVVSHIVDKPSEQDVKEVLYLHHYKNLANITCNAGSNAFWKVEKISDETYPAWEKQHERYLDVKEADKEAEENKIAVDKERANAHSNNNSKSDKKTNEDKKMGTCAKFFFTITLILPIWWLIKLPFTMGVAGVKVIYYIISWPFRLLLCCCCNTKLIPEDDLSVWPKYEF